MSDTRDLVKAARRWFDVTPEMLDEHQKRVLRRAKARQTITSDTNAGFSQTLTFGQRLADRVASVGGSWGFIIGFAIVLAVWVTLNGLLAAKAFDPYPYIFLNLLLSMLAAIQAPVIMMSQNRQAMKDRLDAAHDYEVNLKAEIEIIALHDKLDQMRSQEMETLIRQQEKQIALLTGLREAGRPASSGSV